MRKLKKGDVMLLVKIRDLRDEKDITQIKMSAIMNVSKSNYARWETDETIIPLRHLNDLCNYFDVSMDYITGLSSKRKYLCTNKKLNKYIIGERLKQFRKEKGLTQEALAKELNTTHSTISAYENGKTLILTAFAYEIAKKYNVSLDYLCGRIDTKEKK